MFDRVITGKLMLGQIKSDYVRIDQVRPLLVG
jgi:hypothetical protein